MTEHFITLSTTEPNDYVGLIKLRHADTNSQIITAQIVENGRPKNFAGLTPFFCLITQEITGQGVSEEPVQAFNGNKGTLEYTASDNALQMIGRNEAYFSFRKQTRSGWIEQFSTRSFYYGVEKSIYSQPFKDSNYWWTFKELYREFQTQIDNGTKTWEDFVSSSKEILESVNPEGNVTQLAEALTGDDGTVYPSLKARLDAENNAYSWAEEIEPGGGVRSIFKGALETFKSQIDSKKFNLAVNTDAHAEDNQRLQQYPGSFLSFSHFANIRTLHDVVDAIQINGDAVHGDALGLESVRHQNETIVSLFKDYPLSCDTFFTPGNHDDGSGRLKAALLGKILTPGMVLSDDDFKRIYRTSENSGEVRDGESLYFYKDYPEKKIRLIGLNSSEVDEKIVDENGLIKYPRFVNHAYSEKQLNWLANVALMDVPEDYHTLILQHTPLEFGWDMTGNSSYYNHDMVRDIILAFIQGTNYVGQSTAGIPEFDAAVGADFSKQGERIFVGLFSGHLHNEANYTEAGFNNITLLNSIPDKEDRVIGTLQEEAFSVLEVDVAERKVNIKGFGAAASRSFVY